MPGFFSEFEQTASVFFSFQEFGMTPCKLVIAEVGAGFDPHEAPE